MEEKEEKIVEEQSNTKKEEDTNIKKDKQSRRYVLTINNPIQSDEEFETFLKNLEHIKYFIFQREKGHKEETEHFQIFLVFTISKRFSTIKNLFPTAHIESANGSNIQCRDYCSKSDTRVSGPYEYGEFAEERSRTDIKTLLELIKAGADNTTIMDLFPAQYLRYQDKIERVRQDNYAKEYEEKYRTNLIVTYIYGKSGIGKTFSILNKYGLKNVYRVTDYKKDPWFSYKNQKIVVFEEFRSQFYISDMLNYLDIYPLWLPARYSNKMACFEKVFITSNIPLSGQYKSLKEEQPETFKAFNRRIHHVLYLNEDKVIVEKSRDIEELKSILPESFLSKLDLSQYNYNKALEKPKIKNKQLDILYDEVEVEGDNLPF